jgi:hypothetical protein
MRVLRLKRLGEEVDWPESTVVIRAPCRPGPLGIAVETMDQDDIYPGIWVGVNSCDVETGDLPIDGPLDVVKSEREAPKQMKQCDESACRLCSSADVERPATWKALLTSTRWQHERPAPSDMRFCGTRPRVTDSEDNPGKQAISEA